MFNILYHNSKNVSLYYRDDFDDNGWDEKHFRIFYKKNGERTLALEARHKETSPDKIKEIDLICGKFTKRGEHSKGAEMINYYENKWEELKEKSKPMGIIEIIETAVSNEIEMGKDPKRYKGLIVGEIDESGNITTRIATPEEKDSLLQHFKENER